MLEKTVSCDNSLKKNKPYGLFEKEANLLHKHYGKQMYQLLDLERFDGAIMNQVLDHIDNFRSRMHCSNFL